MSLRRARAALLLLAAAACSDSTGPINRPPADLNILRFAAGAPPLLSNSVTFTACEGTQAEGALYYDDGSGGQGRRFARLRLDDQSLFLRPDGTPFAPGDCVDITMAVVDPGSGELLLELQPTGLQFRATEPAELEMEYREAEGVTPAIEAELGIWRQESPGDSFVRIGTVVIEDLDEVEAELTGFSRYALAY